MMSPTLLVKAFLQEVVWCLLNEILVFVGTLACWGSETAHVQLVQNPHGPRGWVFLRSFLKLKNFFKSTIAKITFWPNVAVEI